VAAELQLRPVGHGQRTASKRGLSYLLASPSFPGAAEGGVSGCLEDLGSALDLSWGGCAKSGDFRLQLLWPEPRTSGELSQATGLKGGNLHYPLKELIYADYVEQRGGRYQLTRLGAQLLITVGCIALQNVQDRGEEGLEMLGGWSEGEG